MTLPLRLLGALPTRIRPPQSPGCRVADRTRRREDDRQIGRADRLDLRAAHDEERRAERVEVALDLRARLNRQRRAVRDVDEALERVDGIGEERAARRDVRGDVRRRVPMLSVMTTASLDGSDEIPPAVTVTR